MFTGYLGRRVLVSPDEAQIVTARETFSRRGTHAVPATIDHHVA
jgi:hypothetical protein